VIATASTDFPQRGLVDADDERPRICDAGPGAGPAVGHGYITLLERLPDAETLWYARKAMEHGWSCRGADLQGLPLRFPRRPRRWQI